VKEKKVDREGVEFAKMFYSFDLDNYEGEEVKRVIEDLRNENKRLKKELKISSKKIAGNTTNFSCHGKYTYTDIYDQVKEKYDFLNNSNVTTLSTAEYLYLNESEKLDYTGVYISYVKVFELELQKVMKKSKEKTTLGILMRELKNRREFKTFIEALEKLSVVNIRNRAVHQRPISKSECGKIRKLLLEEGWLARICYLTEDENCRSDGFVEDEVFVEDFEGRERLNNQTYNCYLIDKEYYLLTKKSIKTGYLKVRGELVNYSGISYLIY